MNNFNGIMIGVVSSGRPVDLKWALSLPTIVAPVGMSIGWMGKQGSDRAENRQLVAEEVKKIGAPYLCFLDDDVACPNFTLRYLHAEIEKDPRIMVCGGIYCTKEDIPEPLVFKKIGGGSFYRWKVGDVFECAGLGCGSMLIKTEVFDKLEKPWFLEPDKVNVDSVTIREVGTDDLYFCEKVRRAGYKIMAHGGVLPVHLDEKGRMYTLPIDSYPCKGMGLKLMEQTLKRRKVCRKRTRH